jgi:GNAT superfamily N-acetyltransferase
MQSRLDTVLLKSGEHLDVVKVVCPEPEWAERILPFLSHKGPHWLKPLRVAFAEGLPPLTLNFFEGVIGDVIVGNITTIEHLSRPVAILQHVFTDPAHRRKGVANHLMRALTDDFRARGGRAMYLGTGYDSPPYWIYHSFGFRGRGETGKMNWFLEDGFEADYFAEGPTEVRDTCWGDWATLEALHALMQGWYLRSFTMSQYGHGGYESEYPALRSALEEGRVLEVKELVKHDGALVGHVYLAKWDAWKGSPLMLELFMHPNFYADGERLVGALAFPEGLKVCALADETSPEKAAILEACGFEREGLLKRQIEGPDGWLDVAIYGR